MRKIRNRIKLMIACAALSVACVGAGAMISGYASTAAEITSDPFFVAGASVKYVHNISEQINQDGLRFAIVVENEEFNSWLNAEQTDFAEGISVGALVLPKDCANGEELTHETPEVYNAKFTFEDFSDSIYEEYSNAKIAYVYLYDIEPDSYNRDYMVSAYQVKDGKTTYTKSVARSMAYIAHSAIKAGDKNTEMLQGYIKQYPVYFYIDGVQSDARQDVRYGDKIDTEKLPTVDEYLVTWYADESFETEFDFEQEITGTTYVYGKTPNRAELTDGVFSYVDNDYSVSGSGADLTLTQTLMNSSKKLGLAKFNVDGTKDYEVSTKISLSTPGAETWIPDESNTRVGLAFYGEGEGANSYIYSYRAGNTVFIRNTNGANELYSDTTDDGRRSFWNERRDYLSDGTTEFTMKLKKLGASISVYINGKLLETLTVESGANLVPAIFSYTFEGVDGKVTVTYSNISVNVCTDICETCGYCADVECTLHAEKCVGVLEYFGEHSPDYKAVKDGNGSWTVSQALGKGGDGNGLAYFNIDENADYTISVEVKLSGNPATAAQGVTVGADMRVGFALIGENNENYRFLFRGTQCALIYYDKSTELYESRNGNEFAETTVGQVTYVYGKTNSTPKEPKLVLQNTDAINGSTEITLSMTKVGNKVSIYLNGEFWNTFELAEGFVGVPALLSYELDGKGGRTHTYSNVNFDVCEAACDVCGYCADVECTLHAEKCVGVLEYFGGHTSDYKAVKDKNGSWTVSQALGNGTDGNGLAYLNVGVSDNYSISMDIKLSGNPATAAQGVNDGADMRVGFALINKNGENYRFLFRGTQCALIYYDKSEELYELRSGDAFAETTVGQVTYVYGKGNSTPKEPKLVLQNTGAINDTKTIKLTLMKVGNEVAVLLNGEYWTKVALAEGFVGVPAILSYSLDGIQRSHAYTNLVIKEMATCEVCGLCAETECVLHTEKCVNTLGYFGEHTSDYKAVKDVNGNWSVKQTLSNGKDNKGLAYFNVDANANYTISVDVKLSGNPATAAQDATVGADMRVGFALINKNGENSENNENYRFLFRGTQCALIYYDKSTELYELRSGNTFAETTVGKVTYVYGKGNSTPKEPKLVLQNTDAINGTTTITLSMTKVGNKVSIYLNGELWNTFELAEGFVGVPALLCYELDGKGGRTHTYSNIDITTGTANE